jgi:hypothetical protein
MQYKSLLALAAIACSSFCHAQMSATSFVGDMDALTKQIVDLRKVVNGTSQGQALSNGEVSLHSCHGSQLSSRLTNRAQGHQERLRRHHQIRNHPGQPEDLPRRSDAIHRNRAEGYLRFLRRSMFESSPRPLFSHLSEHWRSSQIFLVRSCSPLDHRTRSSVYRLLTPSSLTPILS